MSTDFDLITSICTGQEYYTFLGALSQPLSSNMVDQVIFHFLPDELLGIILARLMIISRLLNNPLHCCLHGMASVVRCNKKKRNSYFCPRRLLLSCISHCRIADKYKKKSEIDGNLIKFIIHTLLHLCCLPCPRCERTYWM